MLLGAVVRVLGGRRWAWVLVQVVVLGLAWHHLVLHPGFVASVFRAHHLGGLAGSSCLGLEVGGVGRGSAH